MMDLGIIFQRYVTYCAAFVQRNSRKINSFKDVFKGNSLAGTILEEYYLKRKMKMFFPLMLTCMTLLANCKAILKRQLNLRCPLPDARQLLK